VPEPRRGGQAEATRYNDDPVTPVSAPSFRLGSRDIYYGWVIVAAVSITETVTWGVVYYGSPVFLRPMEQDLGASRVAITAAFSVGLGVAALAALPVGRWIDRHGGRGLMTAGSCLATPLRASLRRRRLLVPAGPRSRPADRHARGRLRVDDLHADRGLAADARGLAHGADDPGGRAGRHHESHPRLRAPAQSDRAAGSRGRRRTPR
jgi:hypothetical protein